MNQPSPRRYIDLLDAGKSAVSNVERIEPRTAMGETMMLGLRLLDDGVSALAFSLRHGESILAAFGITLSQLTSLGLIEFDGEGVRLTQRGILMATRFARSFSKLWRTTPSAWAAVRARQQCPSRANPWREI